MKQVILKSIAIAASLAGVVNLGGCAATEVAIEHHDLDVRSQMSSTVFLKPVSDTEHTVYVQVKNTTDKNIDTGLFTQNLNAELAQKGYRAVPFQDAHYLLQVNFLQVGKMDPSAASMALNAGFGGAVAGGVLAAANGSSGRGIAGGALAGGVVDLVADALVKNVTYTAITDIQITENNPGNIPPGVYRTRMLSSANQVNLDFQDALPKLRNQVVQSIAGIF